MNEAQERQHRLVIAQYVLAVLAAMLHARPVPPLPQELSWREIYTEARRQSLENMVLAGVEPELLQEPELLNAWHKRRDTNLAQMLTQIAEQERALTAFSDAGIPVLHVKGSAVRALYPRPEYRQMSDIDLLVAPQDMERAGALLCSLGYTQDQEDRRQDNEMSYFLPPYMSIELHDNPVDRKDPHAAYYEMIWNKTEQDTLPGVYHLRTEDEYLYMLAHFLKHYETAGVGVRQVLDIYLFRQAYGSRMDETYLAQESESLKLEPVRGQVEQLADLWFGEAAKQFAPDDAVEKMGRFCILAGIYGSEYVRRNNMMQKELEKGKRWKLSYVLRRLFPPMKEFLMRYPKVRSAPWMYPVYWLQRFFDPHYWKYKFRSEIAEMRNADRKP